MKKKISIIFCFILCLFACLGANFEAPVKADGGLTVTGIATILKDGDVNVVPESVDTYRAGFRTSDSPYKTYTLVTDLTLSTGQPFNELDGISQNLIIQRITWSINGTPVTFSEYLYQSDDLDIRLSGKDLEITPLKPGSYTFSCSVDGVAHNTTLVCDYAKPTQLNLTVEGNKNQLYESFTDITLKAVINNQGFFDPNVNYTYNWYIYSTDEKNLIANQNTNTLVVTKNMIKIDKIKFYVKLKVDSVTTLERSVEIVITTEQEYTVSLNLTEPVEMEQTSTSLNLKASVPSNNYTVTWFLCGPTSYVFEEQKTTDSGFTFNPSKFTPGKYKVFSKATITEEEGNTVECLSDVLVINIKKPETDTKDVVLEITERAYPNEETGVQGFELSVDLQDAYSSDRIVWMIEGAAFGRGDQIKFDPILANEYYIELRLLDNNGRIITTGGPLAYITIDAEPVKSGSIWVFIGIAAAVIAVACVVTILVANKSREKIW